MPLARAIPRAAVVILLGLAAAACETVLAPEPTTAPPVTMSPTPLADPEPTVTGPTARMPREIRAGFAEMVIQRVEREVTREEVAAAVQNMITNAPICTPWPAVWIEGVGRSNFVVRYDLMARDWGPGATASGDARMEEFVAMGFLTKRERLDLGPRAIEYTITPEGRLHMRGALESGSRVSFCSPAERRLVALTSMEWGEYPCGTLLVRFTHVGDDWPSWARSEATRARLAATWPAVGTLAEGSVSLGRQWYRAYDLPAGMRNGELRSLCYDAERERVVGDDLNLSAQ